MLFLESKNLKQLKLSLIAILLSFYTFSQELNYSYFTKSSEALKSFLFDNGEYFSGGNFDLPYFQGKSNNTYTRCALIKQ